MMDIATHIELLSTMATELYSRRVSDGVCLVVLNASRVPAFSDEEMSFIIVLYMFNIGRPAFPPKKRDIAYS